jgi:hypothetical protein
MTAAANGGVCSSQLGGAAGLRDASTGSAPRRARQCVCVTANGGVRSSQRVCAEVSWDQPAGWGPGGVLAGGDTTAQVSRMRSVSPSRGE